MHPPPNKDIAALFNEMADLLEISPGVGAFDRHRVRSFRRAAKIIESLPHGVAAMVRDGRLQQMRGVGEGAVHRLRQILRRGSCDDLDQLRRAVPPGLRELLQVRGIGSTRVRLMHQHLGVASIQQLEHAARSGQLARLPRLGEKAVEKITAAIADHRRHVARLPLPRALKVGASLLEQTRALAVVDRAELVGSVRRHKETVGDLDLIAAAANPQAVVSAFCTFADFSEVLHCGQSMASARLPTGQQADIWVVREHEVGAALHAYSGSQPHVVSIRDRAARKGLHISEHGVFTRDRSRRISGELEEHVFAAVGLPHIPPELREHGGELEAAERGMLPQLLTEQDLLGDLHMHTVDSDGLATASQMADAARELGLRYIAITDHTKSLSVANGLDERRLRAQLQALRHLDARRDDIRILAGTEVDILPDGSLDIPHELLRQLDWVVASVHSHFDLDGRAMTRRFIRAMESGVVDCIGHPRGRRLGKRDPYPLDLDRILEAARRLDVAVELNASAGRLDLDGVSCRQAKERGVRVAVNSDAHALEELARHRALGARIARRGWLEKNDVVNCAPPEQLEARRLARQRRELALVVGAEPTATESEANSAKPSPQQQRSESDSPGAVSPGSMTSGFGSEEEKLAAQLGAALDAGGMSPELKERLRAYMHGAVDNVLARALEHHGQNPLQLAFNLLLASNLES